MKPTFLFGAIAVAVVAFLSYTMLKGHQEKIHLIQQQSEHEEAVQNTQADVAVMLRQIDEYRKRLPAQPNPSWLVSEAVALGEQSGLQFTAISQDAPRELQSQFTRLAITLEFAASYHELGRFLDRVEHSNRFMRVEHLDVTSPRERGGQATVQLTLSTVYVPPAVKGSGSTGSPVALSLGQRPRDPSRGIPSESEGSGRSEARSPGG